MKKWLLAGFLVMFGASAYAVDLQLGVGAHYWRTLDDIKDGGQFDDDGVAYMATVQLGWNDFVKFEGDLEVFPDGFAGTEDSAYAPQAYLIVGSTIYAGLGVGTVYSSDFEDDVTDPFYVLRAGLNLELLPNIFLDVNANYHFLEWEEIEGVEDDIDSDTVILGAAVRVAI